MKRAALTSKRAKLLRKFFRTITKTTIKKMVFVRWLNEDESLWDCSNDEQSIAVVLCEDFVSTYADSLDMYDEVEEKKISINMRKETEEDAQV